MQPPTIYIRLFISIEEEDPEGDERAEEKGLGRDIGSSVIFGRY